MKVCSILEVPLVTRWSSLWSIQQHWLTDWLTSHWSWRSESCFSCWVLLVGLHTDLRVVKACLAFRILDGSLWHPHLFLWPAVETMLLGQARKEVVSFRFLPFILIASVVVAVVGQGSSSPLFSLCSPKLLPVFDASSANLLLFTCISSNLWEIRHISSLAKSDRLSFFFLWVCPFYANFLVACLLSVALSSLPHSGKTLEVIGSLVLLLSSLRRILRVSGCGLLGMQHYRTDSCWMRCISVGGSP